MSEAIAAVQRSDEPVSYDSVPDYEHFGLGCFLLAGSETARLSPQ